MEHLDNLMCQICMKIFHDKRKPILLPCGHSLCEKCLSKLLYSELNFFCPFDRKFSKLNQCKPNQRLLNLSLKAIKNNPDVINRIQNSVKMKKIENKSRTPNPVKKHSLGLPIDNLFSYADSPTTANCSILTTPINRTPRTNRQNMYHTKFTPSSIPCHSLEINHAQQTLKSHKRNRRHRTKSKPKIQSEFSLQNFVVLTASIIGGLYLYNKLSGGHGNRMFTENKSKVMTNGIKGTSGEVVSKLLKFINYKS